MSARGEQARALAERLFDPLVLTAVGGVAFVGSATHVYELARAHGQAGASAWEVTALTEVLFAYAGVDLRRRAGAWKLAPALAMAATCGFMVWANLASTLDRSFAGLLIAVWPAAVFMLNIALAESPSGRRAPERLPEHPERSVMETGEELEWIEPVRLQTDGPPAPLRAVPATGRGVGSLTARVDEREQALAEHLASKHPSTAALARALGVSPSRARALVAEYKRGLQ